MVKDYSWPDISDTASIAKIITVVTITVIAYFVVASGEGPPITYQVDLPVLFFPGSWSIP